MRRHLWLLCVALVVIACDQTPSGLPCDESADIQTALCGESLEEPTGLVLVVGDKAIDVDAGTETRILNLPPIDVEGSEPADNPFWAQRVGDHSVIGCVYGCGGANVFTVARGSLEAAPVAVGHPIPGIDGVWIREECSMAKIDWAGSALTDEVPFECSIGFEEETSVGLVGFQESGDRFNGLVLDPNDLAPLVETALIRGVFDTRILHGAGSFQVLDTATGEEVEIPVPTRRGSADFGRLSPDGRYLAVPFKHPAQILDVWLLDTESLEWSQVPSMPVAAFVKGTDVQWADDGRLVIHGEFEGAGYQLATWQPGDPTLRVRNVPWVSGATMVVWCTLDGCA